MPMTKPLIGNYGKINQIGKLLTKLGIDEVHDEDMDFADL